MSDTSEIRFKDLTVGQKFTFTGFTPRRGRPRVYTKQSVQNYTTRTGAVERLYKLTAPVRPLTTGGDRRFTEDVL